MMARLRYRAMYATSALIGYALAGALTMLGQRWRTSPRALVRHQARRHAIDAARKRGPYLAPITLVGALAGIVVFGALLIRAAS